MNISAKSVKMRDVPPTGVRLAPELKAALAREATINGRTLHAEILLRLMASLKQDFVPTKLGRPSAPLMAQEDQAVYSVSDLSDTDRAMLGVFRRMPPEKQLALLSLFK